MVMDLESTKIGQNQYPLLINGRNRYGIIEPIRLPKKITEGLPATGLYQGLYASDKWMLLFIAGKAYVKDFTTNLPFWQVAGFQMSTTAPVIYACPVSAATVLFKRQLTTGSNKDVTLTSGISGSPTCIICQDGENQPWIIQSDGSARITQTYDEWQLEGPTLPNNHQEYVPIGKQMIYTGGILYLAAKDESERYTQIFRSVSGRPLDFMVNIDSAGNKQPTEELGGAAQVSNRVSSEEITGMIASDVSVGGFIVYTLKSSTMVIPDFVNTIFNEPKFTNIPVLMTGAKNQFSIVNIDGATAFIGQDSGIDGFNAVQQYRLEGNAKTFSSPVSGLFKLPGEQRSILQSTCCSHATNSYVFFSMDTIYGPAVVVYDTFLDCFVCIDRYWNDTTTKIKQFAELKLNGQEFVYFITNTNELFEIFEGTAYATCTLYSGEYCSQDPKIGQKPQFINLCFTNIYDQGNVSVELFVDQISIVSKSHTLVNTIDIPTVPIPIPFPYFQSPKSKALSYPFLQDSRTGWKSGYLISWNFNASLSAIHAVCQDDSSNITFQQQVTINNQYVPQATTPIYQ